MVTGWSPGISMHCLFCIGTVVAIPVIYVGSLYLFDRHQLHTDHSQTIKARIVGAFFSTTIICIVTYILLKPDYDKPTQTMGLFIDTDVLLNNLRVLGLTSFVYMGTILMNYLDESFSQILSIDEWKESLCDLKWWKHMIVAPLTEELAFRSCLAILLRHCFGSDVALYFGPMFFSLCHYHHIKNDIDHGNTFLEAFMERSIQAIYTYLFGVYATFLFFGTNNILPPILAHALCNKLELPRVFDVGTIRPKAIQPFIYATHIIGACLFIYFLPSMR